MPDESKPEPPGGNVGGEQQPPPFEPDEDLITYLEERREPRN
jgi:hypothetical protein